MDLGLSRFVCMRSFFQYPRFVTPIRLRDQPGEAGRPSPDEGTPTGPLTLTSRAPSATAKRLTRVQLNDQRFVDLSTELIAVRRLLEHAFQLRGVDRDPGRQADGLGQLHRVDDAQLLLGLLAHGNGVAGLDQVGRDVDDFTVHGDALVRDQLASFGARGAEAHAVNDVVQTAFQQRQQVHAGRALAALGFSEVAAELTLQHAIHALDLLLFTPLQTEVGGALTGGTAVLAGLRVELGLVRDGATGALQEQVGAFAAGKFG